MTDMQEMDGSTFSDAPATPIEQTTPAISPESDNRDISPERDERDIMSKVWKKHQAEGDDEPAAPAGDERDEKGRFKPKSGEEAKSGEDAKPDDAQARVARPDDAPGAFDILPAEVKREWANIPASARTALATSYQKMAAQAAEAGRIKSGLGPIQDVYNQIARTAPEIRNMTPQEAARTMGETLNMRLQIQRDTVPNLIRIAQQFGKIEDLRAALLPRPQSQPQQGQQAQPAQTQREAFLMQQMAQMQRQMQQMANPDTITGTVERTLKTREVEQTVSKWAAEKPYYKALEPHLPSFVDEAVAALGEGASYEDVLDAAYNMAVDRFSLQAPAPQHAPQDGGRTEAARRATSANVRSRGTHQTPMSEEDEMRQAYRRATRG